MTNFSHPIAFQRWLLDSHFPYEGPISVIADEVWASVHEFTSSLPSCYFEKPLPSNYHQRWQCFYDSVLRSKVDLLIIYLTK